MPLSYMAAVEPRSVARWLGLGLVAALGFVVVAAATVRVTGRDGDPPAGPVLTDKLDWLRAHAADYDLIFAGTSRVHYHVDPGRLDPAMAAAGCPLRSFNMGVQGLTSAELLWLLPRLAEVEREAGVHWPVIAVDRPQIALRILRELGTERLAYTMRQPGAVRTLLDGIWTSSRSLLNKVMDSRDVLLAWLYYRLEPGVLARRLLPLAPALQGGPGLTVDLARGGFVPLEEETDPMLPPRRAAINWESFGQELDRVMQLDTEAARLSDARAAHFRAQLDAARAVAPSVVLVLMPQATRDWVADSKALEQAAAEGRLGDVAVVNLGDPARYPQLFARELWFDTDHVAAEGVQRLNAALGPALCAALKAKGAVAGG
ncbi:MAG: hypothetical protein U1E14_19045 [Geminicoccaceae bacterium]